MAFTRAHGVAWLLVGVLDIDFIPDRVNWFYRGEVFPLEIEFEDSELFADEVPGADMDMHEGDDDPDARGSPNNEAGRERANGSSPAAQLPGVGSGVESPSAPAVPMNTLRFGSFEPASAPPRLWSDRVESADSFECMLPPLELDDGACPVDDGLLETLSVTAVGGVREVEPQMGLLSPTTSVVSCRIASTVSEVRFGEGGLGQVASASPSISLAPGTPVAPAMVGCGEGREIGRAHV